MVKTVADTALYYVITTMQLQESQYYVMWLFVCVFKDKHSGYKFYFSSGFWQAVISVV